MLTLHVNVMRLSKLRRLWENPHVWLDAHIKVQSSFCSLGVTKWKTTWSYWLKATADHLDAVCPSSQSALKIISVLISYSSQHCFAGFFLFALAIHFGAPSLAGAGNAAVSSNSSSSFWSPCSPSRPSTTSLKHVSGSPVLKWHGAALRMPSFRSVRTGLESCPERGGTLAALPVLGLPGSTSPSS